MNRVITVERSSVLSQMAAEILRLAADPYIRVAVDGFDGAGKTIFADELGEVLAARNHNVIRATVDQFHNPKSIRYARIQNRDGTGSADPSAESNLRYRDGQRIYLREAIPQEQASRTVDNNDLNAPTITN